MAKKKAVKKKAAPKKATKKRSGKHSETSLKIIGTLDEVLKISIPKKTKKL